MRAALPELAIVATTDYERALAAAPDAEILMIIGWRNTAELMHAARRLRWIQVLTSGTDGTTDNAALPDDVLVTSARGIHGPQVAELTMLLMLMLRRDIPKMVLNQQARRWELWPQHLLLGQTVLVVGLGAIAEALAARCAPFGMRMIGVSDARTSAPGFEAVQPLGRLEHAAAEADIVVVLTPRRPETIGLIGDAVLTAMKPTALLINVARGGIVDEEALVVHLKRGSIAGAGLDVFAIEPLPPESELWGLPNVIVVPHAGGFSATYVEQAMPILIDNLRAFGRGDLDAMQNVVRRPATLRPATPARNPA